MKVLLVVSAILIVTDVSARDWKVSIDDINILYDNGCLFADDDDMYTVPGHTYGSANNWLDCAAYCTRDRFQCTHFNFDSNGDCHIQHNLGSKLEIGSSNQNIVCGFIKGRSQQSV